MKNKEKPAGGPEGLPDSFSGIPACWKQEIEEMIDEKIKQLELKLKADMQVSHLIGF